MHDGNPVLLCHRKWTPAEISKKFPRLQDVHKHSNNVIVFHESSPTPMSGMQGIKWMQSEQTLKTMDTKVCFLFAPLSPLSCSRSLLSLLSRSRSLAVSLAVVLFFFFSLSCIFSIFSLPPHNLRISSVTQNRRIPTLPTIIGMAQ